MQRTLLSCFMVFLASSALAQIPEEAVSPLSKSNRDALIRSALARDIGDITAIEASLLGGGGVVMGYTSGSIVKCHDKNVCKKFAGTPSSAVIGAVTGIAVSLRGDQEVIWASYPHGVFYQCINYACREFTWDTESEN